ncbi:hypothetical protein DY000_02037548 [Brassica cretica]|uniref:Uncharacterized protein n=1 Tax=Brassica cretica TaxID=69181 RepID=A0ABQ7BHB4_BRACR|nr:hypothetical protein DY000_02037548 [Brassica cretica]
MGQPDKTMSVNGQELFTSSVCLLLSSVTLIRDGLVGDVIFIYWCVMLSEMYSQTENKANTKLDNDYIEIEMCLQAFRCMTSRHTRRNAQREPVTLSNQELARLERTNREQSRPDNVTMGDYGNQEQLTAQLQQMQQRMLQMQQTIQA